MKRIDECGSMAVLVALLVVGILLVMGAYRSIIGGLFFLVLGSPDKEVFFAGLGITGRRGFLYQFIQRICRDAVFTNSK